jgi:hypothetical protein
MLLGIALIAYKNHSVQAQSGYGWAARRELAREDLGL